jgi:hypothetical protein
MLQLYFRKSFSVRVTLGLREEERKKKAKRTAKTEAEKRKSAAGLGRRKK